MIALKPGVRVRGVSNEILLALMIAKEVFENFKEDMTITSITDGQHMAGSLHYTGDAVDLRLPIERAAIIGVLKVKLGTSYDVVLEEDHLHIEYDPK